VCFKKWSRDTRIWSGLYISAHTLSGTSASYGFPRFSEIAGKLAHVFQYALNAPLGSDLHGPLTEFLSDGISLLETDLLEISDTGKENAMTSLFSRSAIALRSRRNRRP